ncbi:hypothetical protein PAHAL_4G066300 [Panicum hallii]|uniref:Uncharacterized protein n=1 Tax=Panicum hallii TaxID=206008 RepID=A0A2T8JC16_9POAL|nr:hypothetical protein PAHAL_4G066300 [Panicum hallii]
MVGGERLVHEVGGGEGARLAWHLATEVVASGPGSERHDGATSGHGGALPGWANGPAGRVELLGLPGPSPLDVTNVVGFF